MMKKKILFLFIFLLNSFISFTQVFTIHDQDSPVLGWSGGASWQNVPVFVVFSTNFPNDDWLPGLYFQNPQAASGTEIFTYDSQLDFSLCGDYKLTFDICNADATAFFTGITYQNILEIEIQTTTSGSWTNIGNYNTSIGTWTSQSIDLNIYKGGNQVKFRFKGTHSTDGQTGFLGTGAYDIGIRYFKVTRTLPEATVAITSGTNPTCENSSVEFTASLNNLFGGTVSYLWKKNGSPIVGETAPTYTTTTLNNTDEISCDITLTGSTSCNNIYNSNIINMTVNPFSTPTVTIAQTPIGTVCEGSTILFTAQPVNGGTAPAYKWSLDGGTTTISTATSYSTNTLIDGDILSLEMTSNVTCPASNPVTDDYTATMYDTTKVSIIPTELCAGVATNFTINTTTATGTSIYQWTLNGANTVATPGYSGTFSAGDKIMLSESSSTTCEGRSNTVTIMGKPAKPTTPVGITTLCQNSPNIGYLTNTISNATSYMWTVTGGTNAITGNSTTGTVNWEDTYSGTADITVTANNTCGDSPISDILTVLINPDFKITTQPKDEAQCLGSSNVFTIGAEGLGVTYQWYNDAGLIVMQTNTSYTIASTVLGDAGNYFCWVYGTCGAPISSNTVTLGIKVNTEISSHPESAAICPNQQNELSVTATGEGSLEYMWIKDEVDITSAVSSKYAISTANETDAGVYKCRVTGECGDIETNTATITIKDTIAISMSANDFTICSDETQILTATTTGEATLSYQWKKDNTNIAGETSHTLTVSEAGNYNLKVTDGCNNTALGETVTVQVQQLDADKTITGSTVCEGEDATITISSAQAGVSYTATPTDGISVSETGTGDDLILTISGTDLKGTTNTFKISGTIATCTTDLSDATIISNPNPVEKTFSGNQICEGEEAKILLETSEPGISYNFSIEDNSINETTGDGSDVEIIVSVDELSIGENIISILAENKTTGCNTNFTQTGVITVTAYPDIDMEVEGDADVCTGDDIAIIVNFTQEAVNYILYKNDIATQDSLTGMTSIEFPLESLKAGYDIYKVYAKNLDGCNKMLLDSAVINISVCEMIIPEAFSPNGDGKNDVFFIEGLSKYPNTSLMIMNRWGVKVFDADIYKNDWDGSANTGIVIGDKNLPVGIYYYILNKNDGSDIIKGSIYLGK